MIPRLSSLPKSLPAAIAERVEETVEDCSGHSKHPSKNERPRLLEALLLG